MFDFEHTRLADARTLNMRVHIYFKYTDLNTVFIKKHTSMFLNSREIKAVEISSNRRNLVFENIKHCSMCRFFDRWNDINVKTIVLIIWNVNVIKRAYKLNIIIPSNSFTLKRKNNVFWLHNSCEAKRHS